MRSVCVALFVLVVAAGLPPPLARYSAASYGETRRSLGEGGQPRENELVAQAPDVPHGTVTKSTWKSTIFPGTERDYWVYVPAQYDGTKAAAVMVFQDGAAYIKPDGAWKVHEAFDRLIAAGEMPVTIGLFISPGVLPPPRTDALARFNRSFEYDAVSDRYARFLLEEMLPEVGKQYKLTTDPNLRAIGGASSGAIAAFTVAWERPDAFRRVFSTIGTYVGLRGGNDYATYVRKTEPKPLRVFLQDGSNDLNIYGGNWWVANQDMLSALEFSGYEVNHVWGDGGHDSKQGAAILADALRWLWKDWTTPIRAGVGSKQPLMDVLEEGSDWQMVGAEYGFADGPASSPSGEVFFSDTKEGHIYKIGLDGAVTMFVKDAPGTAGLMFGPDGRLYASLHGPRQVVAYRFGGRAQGDCRRHRRRRPRDQRQRTSLCQRRGQETALAHRARRHERSGRQEPRAPERPDPHAGSDAALRGRHEEPVDLGISDQFQWRAGVPHSRTATCTSLMAPSTAAPMA